MPTAAQRSAAHEPCINRRMTTPEQQRVTTEERTSAGASSLAVPMVLLILAIVCGAASLALTVFGVWPAALLVLLCGVLAAYAVTKVRKHEPRSSR